MRFLPSAVLGLFAATFLLIPAARAQTPQTTATAPAATTPAVPQTDSSWMEYYDPYSAAQNDISTPHRSSDEIVTWAVSSLTNAMTFTPQNFSAHLADIKQYFTQQGWYEYAAYMKESRMVEMIRDQNYSVTTIINGDAAVINSATSGGSYHWLVSAPIIVSFSYPDAEGNPAPVPGGSFRATLQIGRMSEGGGEDGIAIESWKVNTIDR